MTLNDLNMILNNFEKNLKNKFFRNLHTLEALDEPTAKWNVPLNDGNHVIEFEHGTATGRRLVRIDGKEIFHRDWMFNLVGDEVFMFNGNKFVIRIDPIPGKYIFYINHTYRSIKRSHSLNKLHRFKIFLHIVGEWQDLQTFCEIAVKNFGNLVG